MVTTRRGHKKVTTGQSTATNKKGTTTSTETNVSASATLTEGSASASTTAATTHTKPSDEGTRVTRSFTQCYPRNLRQVPAYPCGHLAVAIGGINEEDSSSLEESVAM